ncbi:UDP-glucose 4-epimerase GalE [uncultured Mailhella sp.]|uniref:UDP-glucose 4-epimerase GalE n=1 Tax=uncultured Mailhella sp. TaxID=1981031 RepID=UPI0025EAF56F|nr:UDP-glucose 4-epimerase GalE [uncultured Mailhella sp.]
MLVFLAGGAGYIGSHTAVELQNSGHDIVIADNYSNSSPEVIKRISELTHRDVAAYEADVCDKAAMLRIMTAHRIDCVMHFAGLKAVGESVKKPLAYYRNNIDATLTLLECMQKCDIHSIVFSSSATVYGEENPYPYVETMPRGRCSNPYGWTKSMMEQILEDAARADPRLSVVLLRYFNPIGAHQSGLLGEDPQGVPNNLMPYVAQVAVGRRDHLTIFGHDYPTPDGTCRRDYIHVMDLAAGHVRAVEYAAEHKGTAVFNLGTGMPYSVLDIVTAFERNSGVRVRYEFGPRREGDLPEFWADADKARKILGWSASRNLDDMCRDSWNWQKRNPAGYKTGCL